MKNYVAVIRSRKATEDAGETAEIVSSLASRGVFFDVIKCVPYDDNAEITAAFREMRGCAGNALVVCPAGMFPSVRTYLEKIYSAAFDNKSVLHHDGGAVVLADEGFKKITPDMILDVLAFSCVTPLVFRTVGAPADAVNKALEDGADGELSYRVHGKYGELTIEMFYGPETSRVKTDTASRAIICDLNDYIYSLDTSSLEEQIYTLLKLRRMKLSVSESFTGGGVSKRLVGVSGISEVFYEGLNTYSNESKTARLGVSKNTLAMYGAVSPQTAKEMAEGLFSSGRCDIALSTTGIAGPRSDGTDKPVGLCYIGVAVRGRTETYEYRFEGDRKEITETAINKALFLIYKTLKNSGALK